MYNFFHWITLLAQSLLQVGVECSCSLSERSVKHCLCRQDYTVLCLIAGTEFVCQR